MKIELDSLKCVKLLATKGWDIPKAEALVEVFTDIDLRNIYNKLEVDTMLGEAVERVFAREQEKVRVEREASEKRLEFLEKRFETEQRETQEEFRHARQEARQEALNFRRWTVGTIITCTIALAGYLSTLLHVPH